MTCHSANSAHFVRPPLLTWQPNGNAEAVHRPLLRPSSPLPPAQLPASERGTLILPTAIECRIILPQRELGCSCCTCNEIGDDSRSCALPALPSVAFVAAQLVGPLRKAVREKALHPLLLYCCDSYLFEAGKLSPHRKGAYRLPP